jgi:hypothetical protein
MRLAMSWISGHAKSSQLCLTRRAKCSQASRRLQAEVALVKAGAALGEGWSGVARHEVNFRKIRDHAQKRCAIEDAGKIAKRYKRRALLARDFRLLLQLEETDGLLSARLEKFEKVARST